MAKLSAHGKELVRFKREHANNGNGAGRWVDLFAVMEDGYVLKRTTFYRPEGGSVRWGWMIGAHLRAEKIGEFINKMLDHNVVVVSDNREKVEHNDAHPSI